MSSQIYRTTVIWRDVALATRAGNILKEKLFIFGRQNNLFHAWVCPPSLCVIDTITRTWKAASHLGVTWGDLDVLRQNLTTKSFFFLFWLTEANFKHPLLITASRLWGFSYWLIGPISSNQLYLRFRKMMLELTCSILIPEVSSCRQR